METFETNLAGTDGLINGLVSETIHQDLGRLFTFSAIDGSMVMEIYKDESGHWKRAGGTDPYLSGWIDELGDQIDQHNSPAY